MSLPRWTHLRSTFMERTANSKLIWDLLKWSVWWSKAHTTHTHSLPHLRHQKKMIVSCLVKSGRGFRSREKPKGYDNISPPSRRTSPGVMDPKTLPIIVGKFMVHLYDHSLIKIRVLSCPCTRDGDCKTSCFIAWKTPRNEFQPVKCE